MAEARLLQIDYSEKTFRRILNRYLTRISGVKGLYLTDANLKLRQEFAEDFLSNPARLSHVLFSDEKLVTLSSPGPTVSWKLPNRTSPRTPTPRFTRKFMIWGCISLSGVFDVVKVPYGSDGTTTASTYIELLEDVVRPLLVAHPELEFQQDNARCHVAAGPMAYLQLIGKKPMVWPPHSPDFSPVEMVWARMTGLIGSHLSTHPHPETLITQAFENIAKSPRMLNRIWMEVAENIKFAAENGGRQR